MSYKPETTSIYVVYKITTYKLWNIDYNKFDIERFANRAITEDFSRHNRLESLIILLDMVYTRK